MNSRFFSSSVRSTLNHLALAGATLAIVTWIWAGAAAAVVVAVTATAVAFVVVAASLYSCWLKSRIDAPQSVVWDVLINGISVGRLHDSEYAACALRAVSDWRVYVEQMANAGIVAVNVLASYVVGVPLAALWLALVCVIVDPQTVHDQLQLASVQPPAALGRLASQAFVLLLCANTLALAMCVYFGGRRFGFADKFFARTAFEVRLRLGVAVDGAFVFRRCGHAKLIHNPPLTKEI